MKKIGKLRTRIREFFITSEIDENEKQVTQYIYKNACGYFQCPKCKKLLVIIQKIKGLTCSCGYETKIKII